MLYFYATHDVANYYIFITSVCSTPITYIAYKLPLPPLCTTEPSNPKPTHSEKHYTPNYVVCKVGIGADFYAAEETDRNHVNNLNPCLHKKYVYSFKFNFFHFAKGS